MDPGHGDEAELFASFNDELFRSVRRAVRTSVENIEDACATAWAQFLRYQPDRDQNWRGWLYRTATREAIHLRARELGVVHLGPAGQIGKFSELADPRPAPQIEHMVVHEALDTLRRVPERRREVAALKLAGLKYTEIAATLGLSGTRVDKLLREARAQIQAERMRAHSEWSDRRPRVVRLQELEETTPAWLRDVIGRPPVAKPTALLAWRRAALALDDLRGHVGTTRLPRGLGVRPDGVDAGRCYDRALDAVARLREARDATRTLER